MDNTSNQASQTPPSASVNSSVTITGTLFDSVDKCLIDSSPITFTPKSGGTPIATSTDTDGVFSVDLTQTGDWVINPDTSMATYYAFDSQDIKVKAAGDQGKISVKGQAAANAKMLETYVRNVLISLEKIFNKAMKTHPNPTEADVQAEAAFVLSIATNALSPILKNAPAPDPAARAATVQAITEAFRLESNASSASPQVSTCCTTCQRLYAKDQVKLQQCLCCPQCANC